MELNSSLTNVEPLIPVIMRRCHAAKSHGPNKKNADQKERGLWGRECTLKSAFHSTKYSGLKFRVFHATNGTVFSGSLD